MNGQLRERKAFASKQPDTAVFPSTQTSDHPLGAPKHGVPMQALRIVAFTIYFMVCATSIHGAQLLGLPLYWYNKDWYYAYMALTKQYFGIHITTMTYWWSPTVVRVSGDKSVAGLLRQNQAGLLSMDFGERVLYMANHQLYTDWLYMWWAAYTNSPPMHGHIYIILKETLKWTPLIGPAMQLYGFIFMARTWASDQSRLRKGVQSLNSRHSGPMAGQAGSRQLDPMWLLIFPEGTNLSANERRKSQEFCIKSGKTDNRHCLLPRPSGMQLLLQELRDTVPYLYDCTIAYEPIPPGRYGSEIYGLRSVYFQGRPPSSVNMHWRRFKVADIPIDDKASMHEWLDARWREKDDLLDAFQKTGRFPADKSAVHIEGGPDDDLKTAYITTEVRPRATGEFLQMFAPVAAAGVVGRILFQVLWRVWKK